MKLIRKRKKALVYPRQWTPRAKRARVVLEVMIPSLPVNFKTGEPALIGYAGRIARILA